MLVLRLTTRAVEMIEDLLRKDSLPPGGGLRIARRTSGHGLAMSLAAQAYPGDHVVVVDDAVVYLDAAAADRLHGQTLDARRSEVGAAFFV